LSIHQQTFLFSSVYEVMLIQNYWFRERRGEGSFRGRSIHPREHFGRGRGGGGGGYHRDYDNKNRDSFSKDEPYNTRNHKHKHKNTS
jgi:hypothetical protein